MTKEANRHQVQENHYKSKVACLSLLGGYWYLVTYNSDPSRFTVYDLFFSVLLMVAALLVQATVMSLAKNRGAVMDLFAGIFFACNLTILYLVLAVPYLWKLDWYVLVALLVLVWLVAMQFFSSFAIGKGWRKLLVGMAGVLFISQAALAAYFHVDWYLTRNQPLPEQVASADTLTSSQNVRLVEFTRTPNVYFISFDAMLPETLASELLDMPSLEYERTLEENGFLRFPNYFSDAAHTRTAFARLFAFDPQYGNYDGRKITIDGDKITTGFIRSPLREIFRSNGYRIHLYAKISSLTFIGKGEYLDSYEVANLLFTACAHMTNKADFALFGYCSLLTALRARDYISGGLTEEEFVGYTLDSMAQLIERGGRHLFVAYVKFPKHIDASHEFPTPEQLAAFKEEYKQGSAATAVAMDEIMAFVRENDPDAWVYFFSDHGSLMFSRARDDHEDVGQRLRVLDNYGGLGAFYPPQACEDHFVPRQWSTTSMISRDIVRCLAGGVDPFVNDVTYQYVEDGIDVTDYLYE